MKATSESLIIFALIPSHNNRIITKITSNYQSPTSIPLYIYKCDRWSIIGYKFETVTSLRISLPCKFRAPV